MKKIVVFCFSFGLFLGLFVGGARADHADRCNGADTVCGSHEQGWCCPADRPSCGPEGSKAGTCCTLAGDCGGGGPSGGPPPFTPPPPTATGGPVTPGVATPTPPQVSCSQGCRRGSDCVSPLVCSVGTVDSADITYTIGSNVYTAHWSGSSWTNIKQLTSSGLDSSPSFLPNGTGVLFARTSQPGSDRRNLMFINADGTNLRQLFSPSGIYTEDPDFSFDGGRVTYSTGSDIYVIDWNGSVVTNLRQLTNLSLDSDPSFSPDGKFVIFVRALRLGEDRRLLMLMNEDGSNVRQLMSPGAYTQDPSFSSDGNKITYTVGSNVYTVDWNGSNVSNVRQLTSTFRDAEPAFGEGGRQIFFTRANALGEDPRYIMVMNADGSNARQASPASFFTQSPDVIGGLGICRNPQCLSDEDCSCNVSPEVYGCTTNGLTATGIGMLKRNDIALNLDISGSMNSYWSTDGAVSNLDCNQNNPVPAGCEKKIDSSEETVRGFARWLNPASDQMALVTFNNTANVQVRQAFTDNYQEVVDSIIEFNPQGQTPSLFSLLKSNREFNISGRPRSEVEDRYIVVASDGQNNVPFATNSPAYFHFLYGNLNTQASTGVIGGISAQECNSWGSYCPSHANGLIGELLEEGVQVYAVAAGSFEFSNNQIVEIVPDGMVRAAAATSPACAGVNDPTTCLPPTSANQNGVLELQCLEAFNCFEAANASQLDQVMHRIRALMQGNMVLPRLSTNINDVKSAKVYWSYRTRLNNTFDDNVTLSRGSIGTQGVVGTLIAGNVPGIGADSLRPYTYGGNVANLDFIVNQGTGLGISDLGISQFVGNFNTSTFGGGEGAGVMAVFDQATVNPTHEQTLQIKEFNQYLVSQGGGSQYGSYTRNKSDVIVFDLCAEATSETACLQKLSEFSRHAQLTLMIAGRDPNTLKNSELYMKTSNTLSGIPVNGEIIDNGDLPQGIRVPILPLLQRGFKGNSMNTIVIDSYQNTSNGPLIPLTINADNRYVGVQIKSPANGEDMTLMMGALETSCQSNVSLSDVDVAFGNNQIAQSADVSAPMGIGAEDVRIFLRQGSDYQPLSFTGVAVNWKAGRTVTDPDSNSTGPKSNNNCTGSDKEGGTICL